MNRKSKADALAYGLISAALCTSITIRKNPRMGAGASEGAGGTRMILKITYNVGGVGFTAVAENIAQAYEYTQAIIKANALNFPNQEETLSKYMAILAQFKDGKHLKTENHIFKIEVDRSDERIQNLTDTLQDADETIGKMYGTGGAYCDGLIEGYRERTKARAAAWSNG